MLAGKEMDFAVGKAEEVGGTCGVAGGGDDVEMGMALTQSVRGGFSLGRGPDRCRGKGGEFGPVGCDPRDQRQELIAEKIECFRR